MKRIVFFLIVLFTGTITFAQKKVTSDTSRTKTPDTKIKEGASGVRRSIGYKFSSNATDADPGTGLFRYNNPAVSKVTWIFVDNNDISGEDQTNWYSTWNDTTGATARGSINIVEYEGKNVNVFNVTGVFIKSTGYWKIQVEYISGTLPVNGATYYYVFNRIAHQKPQPVQEPQVTTEPKPVQEPPVVQEQKPVDVPAVVQEPNPVVEQPVVQEQKPVDVPAAVQEPNPVQKPPVIPPEKEQQPAQPTQKVRIAPATRTNEAPHPAQTTKPTQTTQPAKAEPAVQTTQPAQQAQQPQQPQTQTTQTVRNAQNYPPEQYNQPTQVARPVDVPNPYSGANLSGTTKRKCYRGIIELGYALGVENYGIDNFRFNFINGIMIGRFSSIGLGLGYRRYFEENITGHTLFSPKSQIPVFLDLRTSFSTRKVTPYLALGIGGAASIIRVNADSTSTKQEGLFLCPSGGVWFNVSDRFAVFAGIAYEMQRLEYILIADDSHFKKNASSVSLNIGIAF